MKIHSQPDQMGGVWANAAAVRHSPHEFTIDFLRCEFGEDGRATSGTLVQRVNMSPLFVSQLITALQENWSKYADKAMPRELFDEIVIEPTHDGSEEGHGGGDVHDGASADDGDRASGSDGASGEGGPP
jgi:hypothetical protein